MGKSQGWGKAKPKDSAWEYKGNQGVGRRLSQRIGMYGKPYVNPLVCKLVSKLKLKIDFEKNYPSWIDSDTPRRHSLLSKKSQCKAWETFIKVTNQVDSQDFQISTEYCHCPFLPAITTW